MKRGGEHPRARYQYGVKPAAKAPFIELAELSVAVSVVLSLRVARLECGRQGKRRRRRSE